MKVKIEMKKFRITKADVKIIKKKRQNVIVEKN